MGFKMIKRIEKKMVKQNPFLLSDIIKTIFPDSIHIPLTNAYLCSMTH